jgi:hypothetical protein
MDNLTGRLRGRCPWPLAACPLATLPARHDAGRAFAPELGGTPPSAEVGFMKRTFPAAIGVSDALHVRPHRRLRPDGSNE